MSELPAPLISLNQVVVQYGTKTALKEISLDIPTGRVTVLIGPSGCGKSTTLKTINRMVEISSGTIQKKSQNLHDLDPVLLRRDIGYAIQSVGLFPHMDVQQNISVVPKLLGWEKERIDQRVSELLDLIGLNPEEYRKKYPSQLSGGESQRVGVARALAADPPILLMDEPFGAVDPLGREILQDEFVRIQRKLKKTIVFVTHDLEEAIRLADYLVIMKDGNIVQASTPEHLLAHPSDDFVRQFLGPDRALKRLTLYTADRILSEAITKEPLLDSPTPPSQKHWWILGEDGLPVSGNMILEGKRQSREIDSRAHVLRPYSSLKEGLSRILALGMPAAPVISDEGKLMGEIRYEDIQRLSYQ